MMSQRLCIKTLRIASLIPALTLWCLVEYSFANFKASDLEKVPDGEALHTNNMVLLEGWHKLPPKQEIIGKPDAPPGEGPPPIMVDVDDAVQHATITVLVAAFREQKCPKTLADLFTKAKNSDRIRIGVIQQNAESDLDCLQGMCELLGTPVSASDLHAGIARDCKYFHQVRMVRMKDTEAKGPVFARARQIEVIEDTDDFCMQIDAHSEAVENWDEMIITEWSQTGNEFAVLTTYPTEVSHLHDGGNNVRTMPYNCNARFVGKGKISNTVASTVGNMEYPFLQPLWAAGLSFMRCHGERDVPTDPHLPSVFSGEEFGRGSRLWTHGYDFYALKQPIVGCWYGDKKGGKGQWRSDSEEAIQSGERLATMLQWPGSDQSASAVAALGKYGLGTRRSLQEYISFCGIDTIKQQIAANCVVKYQPWDWSHAEAMSGYKDVIARRHGGVPAQMSHEDIEANRDAEQVEHEAEQQREQMERAARSQEQHHKDARSDVAVRGRKAMAKRARAHHHPVRDDDVAARVTNDHVDGAGADEAAIDGNALAQRLHMNAKVNPGRFNRKPAPGAGNDDAAVRSQRAQPPRARDASILVRLQSSIADVLFAVAGIVAAFYSLSYLMTVCNSRSPRKAPSKLV
eukprot:m.923519 g.923519  ORF g.923519 m.923519 type:complete len:630 (-) comp23766_c1_seq12:504-2393(-)